MKLVYTLSIEDTAGHSFQIARRIAAEKYHSRINNGLPVVTVALIKDRRIVDVYDGEWQSIHHASRRAKRTAADKPCVVCGRSAAQAAEIDHACCRAAG